MNAKRRQRLREDFERLEALCELNKGLIHFKVLSLDNPPEQYRVTLHCRGVWRDHGEVLEVDQHRIGIYLSQDYPEREPLLQWESPVFHPNIQAPGVCLFGRWNSSVRLDSVCVGLWDMARYHLFSIDDKWNDAAAEWIKKGHRDFPVDRRTLVVPPPAELDAVVGVGDVIRLEVPR